MWVDKMIPILYEVNPQMSMCSCFHFVLFSRFVVISDLEKMDIMMNQTNKHESDATHLRRALLVLDDI